jgi:NAD-dependent SIR2 family protein deacetylase
MGLATLVEKIRKEEVALLVGSGLSLYAGYKGASDLKELIFKQVKSYCKTEDEKTAAKSKNLSEISELLIRYAHSRNDLNKILLQEYKKKPKATHLHDRLSRIPHFEHIFTTNYDTLLEDSMVKRCYVIGSTSHFPVQGNGFPKVYKLHGDVII